MISLHSSRTVDAGAQARAKEIPSATLPGVGTLFHHFAAFRKNPTFYLESLAAQGNILRVGNGPASLYFINHPEYVRQVLVHQAHKVRRPRVLSRASHDLFGPTVTTSDGDVWRVLRQAHQPAFHPTRVQAYTDPMAVLAEEAVNHWRAGEWVEFAPTMRTLSMTLTTRSLLDVDLRNTETLQAILEFSHLFSRHIASIIPLPTWLPTPANWKMHRLVALGHRLVQPLIDARRASGEDRGDVISALLAAQAHDESGLLTDHQIRNEMLHLMVGSHQVTGNTLTFILYALARHPDVQAKLATEIHDTLGMERITHTHLQQLPYLDQVIREALRLFPVGAALVRETAEPLQIDAYEIPRNRWVVISPWTLHRHPDYFDDPDHFAPHRFCPERKATTTHRHSYIPFGTGPRVCLGHAFSMLQLRVVLATILQRWQLMTTPSYTLRTIFRFNLRPADGVPLQVRPRHAFTAAA